MPSTLSQKERIMLNLGVDETTAESILASDKAIDRGEPMDFDLSPTQEKEAKKMANVREHKKPFVPNLPKKARKENVTKSEIIAEIVQFLSENQVISAENVQILNKEKQILFKKGEDMFEINLIQKRKPKN